MKIKFEGSWGEICAEIALMFGVAVPQGVEAAAPKPKATSRGKKNKVEGGEAAPQEVEAAPEETVEDKPKASRRGRPSSPESQEQAKEENASSEPASSGSRRRGRGQSKPAEEKEVEVKLDDLYLSKICSMAATKILPKGVTAILEQFGVASHRDLAEDQRQEFVGLVNVAMEEAE